MKKIVLILLVAFAASATRAKAQNIALQERVPEIKVSTWLRGQRPAPDAKLTYIEFFHSSNKTSFASLAKLKAFSEKSDLNVIIVTQEEEAKIAPILSPYLSVKISVAIDSDNRVFNAFGVSYVPFGVLVDAKNRALWMGNTMQLTPEIIVKSSR